MHEAHYQCIAVIPTYRRPSKLQNTLRAVRTQEYPPDAIIIVNNCDLKETEQILALDESLVVIKPSQNLGGAGAFAVGYERAVQLGATQVWLLDDDAYPESNCLEHLREALGENVAFVAPKVLGTDGIIQHYHYKKRTGALLNSLQVLPPFDDEEASCLSPILISACAFVGPLISVAVVGKDLMPDPNFFLYGDDTDFTLRCRERGLGLLVMTAVVLHDDGRQIMTPRALAQWRRYYEIRNDLKLLYQYGTKLDYAKQLAILLLLISHKLIALLTGSRQKGERNAKRCELIYLTTAVIDHLANLQGKLVEPTDSEIRIKHAEKEECNSHSTTS